MTLNQLTLPSLDLIRGIAFYEMLGLQLIVKALPHYARFVVPDGKTTLSLHLMEALPTGPRVSIYFECTDLDDRVAALCAKGLVFDEPPTDKRWLWREARLRDPDGNQLVLYFAGEHRLDPPWRVGEGSDDGAK